MKRFRPTSAAAMAIICAGATAGGVHWTVEANTGGGGGFVVYGVLIARDFVNGPTGDIVAQAVNSFEAPFDVGGGTVDFGGGLGLHAADVSDISSADATLSLSTTIDGDGSAVVTVGLRSESVSTRTGTSGFSTSVNPNNRAAFSLSVTDAAPGLPVRITVDWTVAFDIETPAPYTLDAAANVDFRMGREGDVTLPIGIVHISAQEDDLPIDRAGSHTLVLAPDDLEREVEFFTFAGGIAGIAGAEGVPGPEEAGSFSSDMVYTVSIRQFCPGDTDGDGLVNFGDLNQVVGSFNATGVVGEHAGDINGDGVVDFADLNMVLNNFGQDGC